MAESTQYIRQWFEGIRDERMTAANTATRVGTAFLMLLDYLLDPSTPFLRKDREDATDYLLRLLAGAVIGESGQIRLNADGTITCQRLEVQGSAVFDELVFNHQNVLEGDTYFTDRGIIEEGEYIGNRQFVLTMRKQYEEEVISFHTYDVLRCAVNDLNAERTYKTSWLRVDSVDTAANTMTVTMYDNEDVPGGVNYPPVATARVVRWGNQLDTARQQTFFISSEDGRFLFLQGVTQPVLTDGNYAAFFGVPPTLDILSNIPLNARQPYVFARGLIVQDIIMLDYLGNPTYTARDRGTWDADTQYVHGYDAAAHGYFSDRVWWGGCLWQAAVSQPTIGQEPRYNNADWACLMGSSNMTIEIESTNGDFFHAGRPFQTTLVAELWNADMKITEAEIGRSNITWTRISDDSDGDAAWNITHAAGTQGLSLAIDSTLDIPGNWEAGSQVGFRIEIRISELNRTFSTQYSIVM